MLNNRVKELKILKSEYTNTHYELEDKLLKYPEKREALCKRIENMSSDFERCKQLPIGTDGLPVFELRIGNTTYTDRKEAATALINACSQVLKQHTTEIKPIGSIYGFDFALTYDIDSYGKKDKYVNAFILGSEQYTTTLTGYRIVNSLEKVIFGIEKLLEINKEQLNKLEIDMTSVKEILDKPFEFEDELSEKEAKLIELTRELKQEQIEAVKKERKNERTYFGKDKILGCFRKNNSKQNELPTQDKNEVSL